jgi:hypothetical protein
LRTLYEFAKFGTLSASARPECMATRAPVAAVSRAVQGLLQFPPAAGVAAPISARAPGRQPTQVDAGDARAGDRSGALSSLSAFHHARDVGLAAGVEPAAGVAARARRDARDRRYEFSETASTRSAWRASTAGRWARSPIVKWPRPHCCGRRAAPGSWAQCRICRKSGRATARAASAPTFRRPSAFRKSDAWP